MTAKGALRVLVVLVLSLVGAQAVSASTNGAAQKRGSHPASVAHPDLHKATHHKRSHRRTPPPPKKPTKPPTKAPTKTPTKTSAPKPAPPTSTSVSPAPPTTTSPAPAPPPPAGNGALPDASNTGVPAGTVLKPSGSLNITTAGAVVDGLDISGTVTISASNVTLKNSRVTAGAYYVILVKDGVTGAVIQNVEVNGRGTSGASGSFGITGSATVKACNVYAVENGLVPDSGSILQNNYVHDLAAPGDAHYDGIQIDGGQSNITIEHNTIINNHDQTSAVMIDNGFGPITNIVAQDNYLAGGGYTVYVDGQFNNGAITGVAFRNNRLTKGTFGYVVIRNNNATWTGNTDKATGASVGS
ncbi:MAG TPA: right-handed parallel beta-helix repeat-containing protein [Jatrophihabitans sp.]|jgi:hypothetical protein